jgi:hypothetical protein
MALTETAPTIPQYACLHCRHRWYPRKEGRPEVCPKCKRTNWDTPPAKPRRGPVSQEVERDIQKFLLFRELAHPDRYAVIMRLMEGEIRLAEQAATTTQEQANAVI